MDKEEDLPELNLGLPPSNRFGAISESVRRNIPETRLCALFCGGRNCKYENASHWTEELQAIRGIYSSWITDNILATSRPNTEMIKANKIIEQFKSFRIKTMINLQTPGEHSSCGPPLEKSGFSYDPQDFMKEGISFYNFAWKDYGFGSASNILDIVRVMQFAISEGKVAVHCHAGLGRTGLLIACYLIYSNRLDANTSIQYVRSKRPGTVQTPSQVKCVQDFALYLKPLRVIFSSVLDDNNGFTLSQFLSRQKLMLHGWEARRLKFLPKVIFVCSERLLELAERSCKNSEHQDLWLITQNRLTASKILLSRDDSSISSHQNLHKRSTDTILENIIVSSIQNCLSLESFTPIRPIHRTATSDQLNTQYRTNEDSSFDERVTSPQNTRRTSLLAAPKKMAPKKHKKNVVSLREKVAEMMALTDYDAERKRMVHKYKNKLNKLSVTWRKLRKEEDVLILSCIIWDWLDELQEPVLDAQDLPVMLRHVHDPLKGLAELEKGDSTIVSFLSYVVACLRPLPDHLEMSLNQRILSTLTHQNMVHEIDDESEVADNFVPIRTANDFGRMRNSVAEKLLTFFNNLIELNEKNLCDCRQTSVNLGKRLK